MKQNTDTLNLVIGNTLTLVYVSVFFDITPQTIHLPLEYESDILFFALVIKNILLNLNPYYSPYLNAPFEGKLYDYPFVSILDYFLILPLSPITKNPFLAINCYIILSYILVFNFTYYACRRLNLDPFISLLLSFVYSIIPYHFIRALVHPFLAIYIAAPLTLLLCAHTSGYIKLKKFELIISIVFIAFSNLYYVFFSLISIIIFSLLSYIEEKRVYIIKNSFFFVVSIISLNLLNYLPTILFQLYEGYSLIISREAWDAELFGLKLTQMLLPPVESILGLNYIANYYNKTAPLITENRFAYIGILGTIGFLIPIFVSSSSAFFNRLTKLNLFLFLFSTIGGLSSLFSYAIIAHFRATNRIITFISLISFILLFTYLYTYLEKINLRRWLVKSLIFILTIFIILELTPKNIGKFRESREIKRFNADVEFSKRLGVLLKPKDKVYVLPFTHALEDKAKFAGGDYTTLRPYLHLGSYGIHLSNATMKGRKEYFWHKWLNELNLKDMVIVLHSLNFAGILVDHFEIFNYGTELKQELINMLGKLPICDSENRLCFYDLRGFKDENDYNIREKQLIDEARQRINLGIFFGRGFYDEEKNDKDMWIWASKRGEIYLINNYPHEKKVKANLLIEPFKGRKIKVILDGKTLTNENSQHVFLEEELIVKPGITKIVITTSSDEVAGGGDLRRLGFRVLNPKFEILD